jgi:HSP20 family protein
MESPQGTRRPPQTAQRSYGSFPRSFGLPDGVEAANVGAEFKDGILLVHLPKTDKSKPQTVDVKVL